MSGNDDALPPDLEQALEVAVDRMAADWRRYLRDLAARCADAAPTTGQQDEALGTSLAFCAHRLRALCDRLDAEAEQ